MQISEARKISIAEYLSLVGFKPARITKSGNELWYSSPIRDGDKNPSFSVNTIKNIWYDFGINKGGNVIDLVCELEKSTFNKAMTTLKNSGLSSHTHLSPAFNQASINLQVIHKIKKISGKKEKNSAFEVLSISKIDRVDLINFLKERKISISIAKKYLKQIHYKPKDKIKSYYALAWACGNGYETRSPYFKGFIGTHKDIIKINLKNNQSLSIFEGFMDFLAFLTYYKISDFKNSVIILNSVSLRKKALEEIENYNFTKAYLFLDNDEAGKDTRNFFINSLNVLVLDKSSLYENYNDFNEMTIEENSNEQ
jgi:DNA primase